MMLNIKTTAFFTSVFLVLAIALASCFHADDHGSWGSNLSDFSGKNEREITFMPGTYVFILNIETVSGELGLRMGVVQHTIFTNDYLTSSIHEFEYTIEERSPVSIIFEGREHSGSFHLSWEIK